MWPYRSNREDVVKTVLPTHTNTHMTIVYSIRVVLRGREGREGRISKHCCSANIVVARWCMIANALDFVELIGRHTHTHTHTTMPMLTDRTNIVVEKRSKKSRKRAYIVHLQAA